MAIDWIEVNDQVKQALSDLGVADPMHQRAYLIVESWRQKCPSCVPQDANGATNYYVIKAAVKDIDSGLDTACDCAGYFTTADVYDAFCRAQAQLPQLPSAPRCGYAWTRFDQATGQPIFAATPAPPDAPQPGAPELATTPAPKQPSFWGIFAFLGACAFAGYEVSRSNRR